MNTDNPVNFVTDAISSCESTGLLLEEFGKHNNDPYLKINFEEKPDLSAGWLRLWKSIDGSPLDRMVYLHLSAGPALTQLLFIFGKPESTFPHMHLQLVNLPGEGLVYNIDILPRIDPIEDFEWFNRVYRQLRRPYRKATQEEQNSCAQAPANPALAVLMSPWGIASQRTDNDELLRVEPQLNEYMKHYLNLTSQSDWSSKDPSAQKQRDRKHLNLFLSDELDPRAWNGVYRVVGKKMGMQIKHIMLNPLN
ncbi:MAG: hypothetical protein VYA80_00400 [Pseudomonadota bacterium]|nr:hypothetical protein [Pseudomonadota bacterium]